MGLGKSCCPERGQYHEVSQINLGPRRSTIRGYSSRQSTTSMIAGKRDSNRQSIYQITNPEDRTVYKGSIKDNIPHGKGQQIHQDGQIYEGQFREGIKQGKGIYKFSDGRLYQGDFLDNRMQGQGKMLWANGDIYQGTFKDNQMHGYGIYKGKDSSQYRGEYVNGQKHGQGWMFLKGKHYEGTWSEGVYMNSNIGK